MALIKVISLLFGIVVALTIIAIRLKAAKKPTSLAKILLPPLFMSTGFAMFLFPEFRVTIAQALEAFVLGALFSILLIKTSKFEVRNSKIFLKRSKAFIFILFGLLIIRSVLKIYLEKSIDLTETSGLFFILAFGMILPWRIAMYVMYRKVEKQMITNNIITTT